MDIVVKSKRIFNPDDPCDTFSCPFCYELKRCCHPNYEEMDNDKCPIRTSNNPEDAKNLVPKDCPLRKQDVHIKFEDGD